MGSDFLGWLGIMPIIDAQAIQPVRGVVGAIEGQPCKVYRLTPTTNGQIISGAPLFDNFPIKFDARPPKTFVENQIFELIDYIGSCNNNVLELGDMVVEFDYRSTGAAYCFAQARPMKPSIFMRCDATGTIMHPHAPAGASSEQPENGIVWNDNYGGTEPQTAQNVVLQDGLYSADPTGLVSPTVIPCAIQPFNRMRSSRQLLMPTEFAQTFFALYMPPTPGYQLEENDEIKLDNQDTYVARQVFTTDNSGIIGWIVLVERKAT